MNSAKEAFQIIDKAKEGIPFKAIEYLYNHESTPEIIEKIIFALENAYTDVYHDEERYWNTPLWYAIVAENHLSDQLIDPVIKLFTTTRDDWDYLNEQGHFLFGLLAQKHPDIAAEKAIAAIMEQLEEKNNYPYLFLFDFMYFIDVECYKDRLLDILSNKNLEFVDAFAMHMADVLIKEAIPVIKEIMKRQDLFFMTRNELKFALEKLETGKDEAAEYAKPYVELRGPWKAHYESLEKIFYDDYEPEPSPLAKAAQSMKTQPQVPKIGRNERVSVEYENGMIKRDIKYKKVEADLDEGKCWLID